MVMEYYITCDMCSSYCDLPDMSTPLWPTGLCIHIRQITPAMSGIRIVGQMSAIKLAMAGTYDHLEI